MTDLSVSVGPMALRTPLVAASGTVGSVVEWAEVAPLAAYGAAVAKSVAPEAWEGRPAPRVAPTEAGMLNSIGIQNPGIDAWRRTHEAAIAGLDIPVWGSAVGHAVAEFVAVARGLVAAGVAAVEINLSCPNLEGEGMFALEPRASAEVVAAVRAEIPSVPIGAKLSPNAEHIDRVAGAVADAGVDWVTLTNTVWGAAIDIDRRRPAISGVVGGYSGVGMKPIAMRCVIEVHRAHPDLPIVGLGGVRTGRDVVEYVMAGADAVAIGTGHFESPKLGARILRSVDRWCRAEGVAALRDLKGVAL